MNFSFDRLFLPNMKLTNIVTLLYPFSLSLATKAPSSHLLPGYQHGYLQHGNASNFSSSTNLSTNATSLLAPFYHNVTTGGAWVLPASPFDLGARAMTCECFDPDGTDTCSFITLSLIAKCNLSACTFTDNMHDRKMLYGLIFRFGPLLHPQERNLL